MLKRISYFLILKMDLSRGDGRGTPNRRQTANAPRKRGWRQGQEKAKSDGHGARRVPQLGAACLPGMGAAAAAMVSSHGHEVCRIPPL